MLTKAGTTTLETDRLILRKYQMDDIHDMFDNWCNDAEVTRYLSWAPHGTPEVTQGIVESWIERYAQPHYFHWVIVHKEHNRAIGDISLLDVDTHIKSAEVGYVLSKNYWGKGLMTEACKAVIAYSFTTAGFTKLYARHHEANIASGKVMTKSGLYYVGITRKPWKEDDSAHTTYKYYEIILS